MHLLESMLNFVAVSQEVQMKKAQQSEPATHQFAGWHSSHGATAAAQSVNIFHHWYRKDFLWRKSPNEATFKP